MYFEGAKLAVYYGNWELMKITVVAQFENKSYFVLKYRV